ncbi:GLPGLI family protein [uncultured Flavobacterium sp.]|uniref:GLPGLI family protein n=1 Tax=uncultured Flavobacterium sp. TaxID=165435 RepID=UPI0030CA5A2D|tara:strand:- start:1078 stop:1956 length:879 start_codon:yes stop_codon:yes gene_type:complete
MKNTILALLFIATACVQAQDFQGMAVYQSKTSTSEMMKNFGGSGRDITPEQMKNFENRMKKMFEKTFVLNFDKSASIYKEEEKLDAPGQNGSGGRMMSSMMGGGGTQYKDVKGKTYAVDKEFFGKEFLIKDSLPSYKWQMSSESKKIGEYTCYKATAIIATEASDFRNFRMRDTNKEKEQKTKDSTAANKKTNFMDGIEQIKDKTITAWYAPEIPINQGPDKYWGLPGLILEVNDGTTIILCSKLALNVKEKADIKEPKTGKVVTQKEYDDTVIKKTQEMREMYRGRSGSGR